ncbi:MAG: SPOR domain-containing protein [Methylohalobius sp. ZOD2]
MARRPAPRNRRSAAASRRPRRVAERKPPRHLRGEHRPAPGWQWVLGIVLLGAFAYFLYYLATDVPSDTAPPRQQVESASTEAETASKQKPAKPPPKAKPKPKPEEPRFTFYTMLPEKEVVIPEGEVRARKRAESLGTAKPDNYLIQAGSFRSYEDADRLKAQLALLGVESRIEKAEIGGAVWHRVRMGPFQSIREVQSIRARLREHRIDSVVQTAKR